MYLIEGTKLHSVWFGENNGYRIDEEYVNIDSITVSIEAGQPWARVVYDYGRVCMLNLAQCTEVRLLEL